jgi:hypothetical protein
MGDGAVHHTLPHEGRGAQQFAPGMREIIRTNDVIVLSFAEALLNDAGLAPLIADANMSVLEGSIGVFPRRVLVPEAAWADARRVLVEAGLKAWIIGDDGG